MRTRHALFALGLSCLGLAATFNLSRADMSPAETARRNAVVLRVGPKEVTAGELEDRLAAVPRFQLATMGDTPETIKRKFLLDVIVPEVLVAAGAEKQHMERNVAVDNSVKTALAKATLRVARSKVPPLGAITKDEVARYYAENKGKFDTPARWSVWRVLCAKREEAVEVIAEAKKQLSVDNFTRLAREHSIDKATNMRAGNLGFLDAEGNSNEAGLKVEPAIAKAAATVRDGELVPEPVPEGGAFAVVWHRSTVPAAHRTVEESAMQIREAIHRQAMDSAARELIEQLRQQRLTELNEGALNGIEVSSVEGEVMPRRRPGQVPPLHPLGRAIPKPSGS